MSLSWQCFSTSGVSLCPSGEVEVWSGYREELECSGFTTRKNLVEFDRMIHELKSLQSLMTVFI